LTNYIYHYKVLDSNALFQLKLEADMEKPSWSQLHEKLKKLAKVLTEYANWIERKEPTIDQIDQIQMILSGMGQTVIDLMKMEPEFVVHYSNTDSAKEKRALEGFYLLMESANDAISTMVSFPQASSLEKELFGAWCKGLDYMMASVNGLATKEAAPRN